MKLRGIDFGEPCVEVSAGGNVYTLSDASNIGQNFLYSFKSRSGETTDWAQRNRPFNIAYFAALARVHILEHTQEAGIMIDCTHVETCPRRLFEKGIDEIFDAVVVVKEIPLVLQVTCEQLKELLFDGVLTQNEQLDAVCVTDDPMQLNIDLVGSVIDALAFVRSANFKIDMPILINSDAAAEQTETLQAAGIGRVVKYVD